MEWPLLLLLIVGGVLFIMASGMPIAFCFMLINLIGVYVFWGGSVGFEQLIASIRDSVSTFTLVPLPLFVLMGDVMFRASIGPMLVETVDKWLGRLPGRLSLVAIGTGTLFGFLSGASMAGVAMLGTTLMPEMEKRGYKKSMTIGPILGSGALVSIIPPSSLAVLIGALGMIPVGPILAAIVLPGLLLAALFALYIIIRCSLQPDLAPPYKTAPASWSQVVVDIVRYVMPLGIIFFLVLGIIFLGFATPSEAAASGTVGSFILAACYKRLNWKVTKEAFASTVQTTVMIFMVIVGSKAFSQILAFTGASQGLIKVGVGLPLPGILIIGATQVVVIIMGTFMDPVSIMMVTLPIYMPIVHALHFDPVWFAVLMLLNTQIANISPPFGMSLFVMRGVATPGTTIGQIYRAAIPFCLLCSVEMALLMAFPSISLWLPNLMSGVRR